MISLTTGLCLTGMFGSHYEPPIGMKNRDADLTNPNIYHSIDDKVDHVYDEIKQKDVKEPGKKIYLKYKTNNFQNV